MHFLLTGVERAAEHLACQPEHHAHTSSCLFAAGRDPFAAREVHELRVLAIDPTHEIGPASSFELDLHPAVVTVRCSVAPRRERAATALPVQRPLDRAEDGALPSAVGADHGNEPVDVEVQVELGERSEVRSFDR